MDTKFKINFWYVIAAMALLLLFQSWWVQSQQVETIPFSQFERLVDGKQIKDVFVAPDYITGTLKEPLKDGRSEFVTTRVDPALTERLAKQGVVVTGVVPSTFLSDLLSWVVPALVFVVVWMLVIRRFAASAQQQMGGLMSIGQSKAKVYVEKNTKTTFGDVAGIDEAKAETKEVVAFLKDQKAHGRLGARLPKGVLLVGPPGTGKTLLARAVAGEAGVPFLSISGSDFVEMFVGIGAARVRDLFQQAAKLAPAIVFIDELDALGRARASGGVIGGNDEKEQTLNQLLTEMDGFDARIGIVILAATNRPEILDPALLRPGRFDRQILLDRPDKAGRIQILAVHVGKIKLASGVELEQIAALTPGFTGADLANLCNEAAILATRAGRDAVSLQDFEAAVERITAGLEKRNRLLNPKERRVVAYHELGHALVALSLPGQDPVQKVSIIPRGIGALGYTMQRPIEDRFLMSEPELEDKMTVLLAGRTAEELVFGEVSTGASDDLQRAADIARAMVTRYGMDKKLGHTAYDTEHGNFLGQPIEGGGRRFSEDTAREIDLAVRDLIEAAYARALEILRRRRDDIERLAKILLEKETLRADELPQPQAPLAQAA
jgi:cell division protease FtsH